MITKNLLNMIYSVPYKGENGYIWMEQVVKMHELNYKEQEELAKFLSTHSREIDDDDWLELVNAFDNE